MNSLVYPKKQKLLRGLRVGARIRSMRNHIQKQSLKICQLCKISL